MKLTNEQLWNLSEGAICYETNEQGELYLRRYEQPGIDFYAEDGKPHPRASTGVRLSMRTDAKEITLVYRAKLATMMHFCFFDATVDGQLIFHWGHDKVTEVVSDYTLTLPEGTHDVEIYFPSLFEIWLQSVVVSDGAKIEPIEKKLNLLTYGDSITQGYNAYYPSQCYANLLADKLGAKLHNLGVGGAMFDPVWIEEDPRPVPDVVTVAYGTNDWVRCQSREEAEKKAKAFYDKLLATYPAAKIFAVTPIFRMDSDQVTAVGTFDDALAIARDAAIAHGVTVIEGDPLVPHLSDAFEDGYLHPNEFGFKCYATALFAAMKPYLKEELAK